jgi:5'-3' exonuclease
MSNYILIDGSYFAFYRFHATQSWWSKAFPDNYLDDPSENEVFVEKYHKMFLERLREIPRKLGVDNAIMIVAKDCKRENNWRYDLHSSVAKTYKAQRTLKEDEFMGGPFFKIIDDEELFEKGGCQYTLQHPKLEADDCIALLCRHVLEQDVGCHIWIISADKDFLQLASANVQIFDLTFKDVIKKESSFGDAQINLFCKILMGDKSDNIAPIFKGCGAKTAVKCYNNPNYFKQRLVDEDAQERYELNRKLIDFNCIPQKYVDEFLKTTE